MNKSEKTPTPNHISPVISLYTCEEIKEKLK